MLRIISIPTNVVSNEAMLSFINVNFIGSERSEYYKSIRWPMVLLIFPIVN